MDFIMYQAFCRSNLAVMFIKSKEQVSFVLVCLES